MKPTGTTTFVLALFLSCAPIPAPMAKSASPQPPVRPGAPMVAQGTAATGPAYPGSAMIVRCHGLR